MLKKFLFILFISITLTGCTKQTAKEEISFSSWGSITEVQIINSVIKNFESENPNIKINFIHIPQNYFQKIHLLFASNTEPDVLFMNNLYLPIYESKLEDLSEMINKKDFYEQSIQNMTYNNKLLGIPRDISNLVLYVNLDKINLPHENWSIEDLIEDAKKQTNKDNFGIGCEEDIYWMSPYLSYFNGGILNNSNELIIDTTESQKALKLYKNLIYRNIAPTKSQIGSSTLAQMFLDKKISMYLSGRWMYPKIKEKADFRWAVINFPYGEGKQLCDTSGWVISKNSKHKKSAKKFVNYLANEENAKFFAQTGLIVPANIKASEILNNKEYNEKVFLKVIEHTQNTPVNKNYKKLTDEINKKYF